MNVELIYFPYGSADLLRRRTECALFSATLSDQVWDRRVETVKSKLSAVEMDLLKILRPIFFFFLTGLLGETDFLLQSQTVWFLSLLTSNMAGTTASYVFVKYLNCCQNKSVILISAVVFSTQTSFLYIQNTTCPGVEAKIYH